MPPMISYQLSALVEWMKTGNKPTAKKWILPGTSLRESDLVAAEPQRVQKVAF